jgi:TPR repeat protein
MKKLLLICIFFSSIFAADTYSQGYKLYKTAKRELRQGNKQKAQILFQQSLKIFLENKKSSQAVLKVAELYCNGWGVDKDTQKAKEYLQKAAKLGGTFISDKCLKTIKGE